MQLGEFFDVVQNSFGHGMVEVIHHIALGELGQRLESVFDAEFSSEKVESLGIRAG